MPFSGLWKSRSLSSACCLFLSVSALVPVEPVLGQIPNQSGTLVDGRDGQSYSWIRIGPQVWMAENLGFETHLGSWCYEDDEARCEEYGRLYEWQAALAACPAGWRLPSEEDWDALEAYLAPQAGRKLRVGEGSGFAAKMAGYRFYDGSYHRLGVSTSFWTSEPYTDDHSLERTLTGDGTELHRDGYGVDGPCPCAV